MKSGIAGTDDVCRVFVCEGPPFCMLQGDEAVAAQRKGCPLCAIYTFEEGMPEEVDCPSQTRQ